MKFSLPSNANLKMGNNEQNIISIHTSVDISHFKTINENLISMKKWNHSNYGYIRPKW